MKVLVTGSKGFIGKNLTQYLKHLPDIDLLEHQRKDSIKKLKNNINKSDFIIHLAGINRIKDKKKDDFKSNFILTKKICDLLIKNKKKTPIIFSSSAQAVKTNTYGISKRKTEKILSFYKKKTGANIFIYRLPNVFGKWSKPNYNSVVATFCYNISRNLPIKIHNPKSKIKLVYIDDVIKSFAKILRQKNRDKNFYKVLPIYKTTVGALAKHIKSFKKSRKSLIIDKVGLGFIRALYSTYVSFLPKNNFIYKIPNHFDSRGSFVEFLKTQNSGQFSFFTSKKGITRGGHFHNSKTEKFLVLQGRAKFSFKHLLTKEKHKLVVSEKKPTVVESIPGWSHDIKNIGNKKLIVMLWSNEIFDIDNPDTYESKI